MYSARVFCLSYTYEMIFVCDSNTVFCLACDLQDMHSFLSTSLRRHHLWRHVICIAWNHFDWRSVANALLQGSVNCHYFLLTVFFGYLSHSIPRFPDNSFQFVKLECDVKLFPDLWKIFFFICNTMIWFCFVVNFIAFLTKNWIRTSSDFCSPGRLNYANCRHKWIGGRRALVANRTRSRGGGGEDAV